MNLVFKEEFKNISEIADESRLYSIDISLSNKLVTSYDKILDFKQEMSGTMLPKLPPLMSLSNHFNLIIK